MAIRNVEAPTRRSGRRTEPVLDKKELEQVVKMLKEGQTPGPDEAFNGPKAARAAIARMQREAQDAVGDEFKVGTRAWEAEDGWRVCLRVRPDDE